jgi:hypothetical protein
VETLGKRRALGILREESSFLRCSKNIEMIVLKAMYINMLFLGIGFLLCYILIQQLSVAATPLKWTISPD